MNDHKMSHKVDELADQLEVAFLRRSTPPQAESDSRQWVLACELLLGRGQMACFDYSVRQLRHTFPHSRALRSLAGIVDKAPDGPAPLMPFIDDKLADVQIVRRPGSDAVLMAFCGNALRLGISLDLIHLWLGRLPASVIYLRDLQKLAGAAGFPSLGPDRFSSIEALQRLIADLGAKRVLTLGGSAGGFPALYYAVALQAEAALILSGATNISAEFEESAGHDRNWSGRIREDFPDYGPDLSSIVECAARPPKALLVYGDSNDRDKAQAENMRGVPSVELVPIPGISDHNIVNLLIQGGRFSELLARLLH